MSGGWSDHFGIHETAVGERSVEERTVEKVEMVGVSGGVVEFSEEERVILAEISERLLRKARERGIKVHRFMECGAEDCFLCGSVWL